MDCQQITEMLDAYALGASGSADAAAIEEHVADCVRCWEELTRAQRTAALLALSVPVREAPQRLEARILEAAARDLRARPPRSEKRRFPIGWPASAAALGIAAAAALAFASLLQVQMNDLRNDKDELARQLQTTRDTMSDQARVISIAAAGDKQAVVMDAVAAPEDAWGEYFWSPSAGGGFIVCHDLPVPPQGQVYQAWFEQNGRLVSAGTFVPSEDGSCAYPMQPLEEVGRPDGVGVSMEEAGGSDAPTGDWLLWAAFAED